MLKADPVIFLERKIMAQGSVVRAAPCVGERFRKSNLRPEDQIRNLFDSMHRTLAAYALAESA
jgi:hypothetical protein